MSGLPRGSMSRAVSKVLISGGIVTGTVALTKPWQAVHGPLEQQPRSVQVSSCAVFDGVSAVETNSGALT